jgi:hypothetical protein
MAERGCSYEFKSPCQRKPVLNYCLRQIALQRRGRAKVVETLKQSSSSQGDTRVLLLLSRKNSMEKLERSVLRLLAYPNIAVKTKKKVFELEPQAGRVLAVEMKLHAFFSFALDLHSIL